MKIQNLKATAKAVFLGALATAAACSESKKDKLTKLQGEKAKIEAQILELQKGEAATADTATQKAREVSTQIINLRPFDYVIHTQGQVASKTNVNVSAKMSGVITQVFVREGDLVKAGQALAQIDNAAMKSSTEELKTNLALAQTVYERQKNLWDQNIGTEVQFLQAKANYEGLQKRLASMQEQLDNYTIRAPFPGSVDAVNAKTGEAAIPGMPSFVINNISNMNAVLKISEAYIAKIKKGDPAMLTFSELGKTIQSEVSFAGRNIDANSRTFPVEVKLPPSQEIRPNMTVLARIVFHHENSALCIPIHAVQDINGEKVVYVAEQSGENWAARRRVVEIKGVFDDMAHVSSGVKKGDRLVTVGFQSLNDGDLIKI